MMYEKRLNLPRYGDLYGDCPKLKSANKLIISRLTDLEGDPLGARTQDPNIKSVVLYQLS